MPVGPFSTTVATTGPRPPWPSDCAMAKLPRLPVHVPGLRRAVPSPSSSTAHEKSNVVLPSEAVESDVICLQILIEPRTCLFQKVTCVSPNLTGSAESKYGTDTVSGLPQLVLIVVPRSGTSVFGAVACGGTQRLSPSGPRASDATNWKALTFGPMLPPSWTWFFVRSSVTV